jgi:Flp pilus assembly protein TadG
MKTRRNRRAERGSSMVELALCLTPFILFLFAAMSFAHAVFAYNSVAFIAHEGSRWAAVRGASSGAPADAASVSAYAKTRAGGLVADNLDVTATWSDVGKAAGSSVTVNVTYQLTTLPLGILKGPLTLTSASTSTILQ